MAGLEFMAGTTSRRIVVGGDLHVVVTLLQATLESVKDRYFLSLGSRVSGGSGAVSSLSAGSQASSGLRNRQAPPTGALPPSTMTLEPRSQVSLPPPGAHPAQAAAADMRLRKRRRGLQGSVGREGTAPRPS